MTGNQKGRKKRPHEPQLYHSLGISGSPAMVPASTSSPAFVRVDVRDLLVDRRGTTSSVSFSFSTTESETSAVGAPLSCGASAEAMTPAFSSASPASGSACFGPWLLTTWRLRVYGLRKHTDDDEDFGRWFRAVSAQ